MVLLYQMHILLIRIHRTKNTVTYRVTSMPVLDPFISI